MISTPIPRELTRMHKHKRARGIQRLPRNFATGAADERTFALIPIDASMEREVDSPQLDYVRANTWPLFVVLLLCGTCYYDVGYILLL